MASDSVPPVPGGGNLKYAIVGVVLIIAALGIWFGMQSCEGPPPPPPPEEVVDAGVVDRGGALVDDTLVIPELEPDAGPVDAGRRVRYVTRYVGGGGGNWNCSGSIEPSAARATLAQQRVQFRNCYERRLKVNHQLEGRVNVQMRVSGSGAVTAVQVGGSMRDGEVLSCVRRIANNLHFPAPTGGCAVVSAPFNFTPRR